MIELQLASAKAEMKIKYRFKAFFKTILMNFIFVTWFLKFLI